MSQIALTPNASGTGTFSIASPNSNTSRTLTLPDETGTVLTSVSSLTATQLTGDVAAARITGALNASGDAPIYACRAWVNFDGVTGPTVRGSGNVSSVTRNSTGNYTVNFTTAMPDANYVVQVTPRPDASAYNQGQVSSTSTGSCIVINAPDQSASFNNTTIMCVSIFR
jgi:hypothetical protein